MVTFIRATLLTMILKERENSYGKMEMFMKVILKKGRGKGMAN